MPQTISLLSRSDTASALTEAGYPVAATTLATMATRGDGPPYQKFGARVLYTWGDALAWAQRRVRPACTTASEHKGADALLHKAA